MTILYEESSALLEDADRDLQEVGYDAEALRSQLAGIGFWNWDGMFIHDSIENIRDKARLAGARAETKLDKVESIVQNAQFSLDEANHLISKKAAVHAAASSLERHLDRLHREAQDSNLFAAVRSIWEEVSSFTRRIVSKLVRVTITATKQLGSNVQRWLLE